MERKRTSPSFVSLLKDCAKKKDLFQGTKIHADIRDSGLLEKDTYLGNTLVSMYVKCDALARAQQVLDELPGQNVFPWNVLIAGYAQHRQGKDALSCFQRMRREGVVPDALTYTRILQACGTMHDSEMGQRIHNDIVNQGLLKKDVGLGTALITMYAKCGVLQKAQEVLEELPVRNVVSWSALIAGYARQGRGQEAMNCFQQMQREGISPNAITYISIMKACGIVQDADMGRRIHDDIVSQGLLQKEVVLGNALVDMYVKCGLLQKAQNVLEELPVRDVISWSALIAGYAQDRQGQKALGCFQQMRREGISPNAITYISILKACGVLQDSEMGKRFHDDIVSQGLLEESVEVGTALVDMYAKCGVLHKAKKVLVEVPVQDVTSWNALIGGYAQHEQTQEALGCFQQMRIEGIYPDAITYTCILRACGTIQDAHMGKRMHSDIASQGLLKKKVLGTPLVDMYVKCLLLRKARKVLEELPARDVGTWNALITGYAQHGQGQEALNCFWQMRSEGVSPDAFTYACILKACATLQDADMGKRIHDDVVSQGLLKKNLVLGTALIEMYVKCGVLQKAQKVLDALPVRNVISWSVLIAGYAEQGHGQEAVSCFHRMCSEGISPDEITYIHILKACGTMPDADMGKRIYDDIVSQGLLKKNVVLGTAVIDMYAKCGLLQKAQKVLEELPLRNVMSWTALIAGYAEQRHGQEALSCFQQMRSEGFSPDKITYLCILKACGTTQDIDMGERIHNDIVTQGLFKNVVLGNALIDMYAKCGALQKAQIVLEELPVRNVVSWSVLIAGYAKHGQGQKALGCFQRMRSEGISPDAITYACILKSCGTSQSADLAKEIHDDILSQGLLNENIMLGTALVDTYVKCGVLQKAQNVLEELPVRDADSWNVMIAGFAEHGQRQKALAFFHRMRSEGISPDNITYSSAMKAMLKS